MKWNSVQDIKHLIICCVEAPHLIYYQYLEEKNVGICS